MKFIKNLLVINLALFLFISCNDDDNDVVNPDNGSATCNAVDFTIAENVGLDLKFEAEKKDDYTYTFEVTQKDAAGATNVSQNVSNGTNSFVWGVGEGEYNVCLNVAIANSSCTPEKTCKTLIVTAKNVVDFNKPETEKTEVFKDNDGKYKLRFLDTNGNEVN
ncbi:hypothetical protein [uncultured Tenacibaculum sp.]|uniref:hypothetical protein n=1 Tax=uncultured Tenacibaculum sp. TaxID=174713 RepID=UPI0026214AE2|nr:hypothetical protein [uncultured Tenacibaculum sp.]